MAPEPAGPRWSFDADRVRDLLIVLDARLRQRGIGASVYVVGGVAVALHAQQRRLTLDVDAIASDQVVYEEAEAMAAEEGLPPNWLNGAAQPWVPPRPAQARRHRETPGLDVHVAPPEHLLAMKILAFRDRDIEDIEDLAAVLKLEDASAEKLRDLVEAVYGDPEVLATSIGGAGPRRSRRTSSTVRKDRPPTSSHSVSTPCAARQ
jgi:predicted nucleotidyltransferase